MTKSHFAHSHSPFLTSLNPGVSQGGKKKKKKISLPRGKISKSIGRQIQAYSLDFASFQSRRKPQSPVPSPQPSSSTAPGAMPGRAGPGRQRAATAGPRHGVGGVAPSCAKRQGFLPSAFLWFALFYSSTPAWASPPVKEQYNTLK